jgi:(1->4)-alpha-D-glucan 1-alpha-D-glucosylmutase
MTTLSTHDTKRSEDVRARLAVLTEMPGEWRAAVTRWASMAAAYRTADAPDPNAEYLFWQTLLGAWPLSMDRAVAYMEKATREAKQRTAWVDGDPAFDAATRQYVEAVIRDDAITADVAAFVESVSAAAGTNSLAQKLIQLTMPGVPDVYQGSESVDLSLVDPDNRRPVDYASRRTALQSTSRGADSGDAKMRVVAAALAARREHPEWYAGSATYDPMHATGPAAGHVIAFARGGGAITIATRLSARLAVTGGWQDTALALPDGRWTDLLTGGVHLGGRPVQMSELVGASGVALLGRTATSTTEG